ncbi:hypothetical protein KAR91_39030 [Candidatus Pacearchaeota archaeon]|nr:hypothetical protein [Candidatus Pacearchaeota archaeon]
MNLMIILLLKMAAQLQPDSFIAEEEMILKGSQRKRRTKPQIIGDG